MNALLSLVSGTIPALTSHNYIFQAIVLGITQGLTEYIPVSSTAHLVLAPEVFPIEGVNHTYNTIIQVGTVFPVLIYFWRDWVKLIAAALRIVKNFRVTKDADERMVSYLVLGSLPAGIIGLLVEKRVNRLSDPAQCQYAFLIIGVALALGGLIMWWAEATSRKSRSVEHIRMADALVVGVAQSCALIPGVSRSGSTITAGLVTGLTREAAARFSFLLMTPIMLAATFYEIAKLLRGAEASTPEEWKGMILATIVAGITGYFAIAFLLGWLRSRTLSVFVIYRLFAGAFSIGLFVMQHGAHVNRHSFSAPLSVRRPAVYSSRWLAGSGVSARTPHPEGATAPQYIIEASAGAVNGSRTRFDKIPARNRLRPDLQLR